jgi:hypothetical protein
MTATISMAIHRVCLMGMIAVILANISSLSIAGSDILQSQTDLETGFKHPPHAAKPSMYWLWLNGYVNHDYLDQELATFAAHGIGGLCIFDMGARGNKDFFPPSGPAFMDEAFLDTVALTAELAQKHELDIQLAACSSWDLGGAWVQPEHASMGLYRSEISVQGPTSYKAALPMPPLPTDAPKTADGHPAFLKDIAVLAIPKVQHQPGYEFIFRLPRDQVHHIDHMVLYNTESDNAKTYGPQHLFARDFSVAVSVGEPKSTDFHEIMRASLAPHTQGQRFDFPPTGARFVRLRIHNGHNSQFDSIQLGEFEVYATNGTNVAASIEIDRTQDSAEIIWCNSELSVGKRWAAANIHDGSKTGASGSWQAAGLPPLLITDRSQIINLTEYLDDQGVLTWQVPQGRWTLMRFVCANTGERLKVPSPQSDGLATDHFSSTATRAFIETLTTRLQQRLGDLRDTRIKQLYLPSYEVVGAKWTPDFLEQFHRYRGYDMTRFLPVLAGCQVESDEQTLRFIYDFRKTLGDLLVDAYYRTASETARAAGLGIEAEAGGPGPPVHQVPVDALKALGAIDEMRGEFWPWRPDRNQLWVVKETACAAHVYGRPRVSMEAFTGFRHWEDGPFDLKPSADRAFCEGMNRVVWHTSSHQPPEAGKPGWVYGAGSHLTPNLVWWPMGKPFLDYLSRCSFLLQQGLFVGDVCYYYGDQGYNFVPPKHIDPSLGDGYDYDVANPEVILTRMQVRDGRITLPDGMQYELLVLPDREDIDLVVLKKIGQLVHAGATVVGPKPTRANGLTDYPRRDREVTQHAERIWGNCDGQGIRSHRFGKGQVIHGLSLRDILAKRGIGPDFQFTSERQDTQIDYIHRRTDQEDIYFVRNKKARAEHIEITCRVTGKVPELWCPQSGRMHTVPAYNQTDQGTRLALSLESYGSVFVVFRHPAPPVHVQTSTPGLQVTHKTDDSLEVSASKSGSYQLETSDKRSLAVTIPDLPKARQLKGPWTLHFAKGWGAPNSVVLPQLRSWTDFEDPGIRHFSGIARYELSFDLPRNWLGSNRQVHLDLGKLWAVGRVRLNGQPLGILWTPPYHVDISDAAHLGQNKLEVEIANTWSNRLVGDTTLPDDQRFCRTNITVSGTPGRPWKDVPLRESGLLGPVRLIPAVRKTVKLR